MKLEKLDSILMWVLSGTLVTEVILNFIGSYGHIYVEGSRYGEHGVDDRILPITIDGMLLALAIANVFAARFNRRSKWLRLGLLLGVGGTVAANAAYGATWGITGGLLSTWAPVALFVTVECGLFVFRIIADLAKESKPAAAVSEPSGGMPDWDALYRTGRITLNQYRAILGITEPAPVDWDNTLSAKNITEVTPAFEAEPREEAQDASEPEGKASKPPLNLNRWQELNGSRNN